MRLKSNHKFLTKREQVLGSFYTHKNDITKPTENPGSISREKQIISGPVGLSQKNNNVVKVC